MNPNYEILEKIMRLDVDAANVTMEWRTAQKELAELQKKSKLSEDLINKSRSEMIFVEGDLRRSYKRADDLDERRSQRTQKLMAAKNDDDHRTLKREVDNLEKESRELMRRVDESEMRIEHYKSLYFKSTEELINVNESSLVERQRAQTAEEKSSSKIQEIKVVRDSHLQKLDDRIYQHYSRLAQVTRNPQGPVSRVVERSCGNCHIGLSPQILNNVARGKDVEFCPNCNHLILPAAAQL